MDIHRSLATLPLEILVEIVSYLPFEGRIASRSVCRPLNSAEYHQRPIRLPEVAVYRTSPKQLTLFAEIHSSNTGETWLACRSVSGQVLNAWRRLGARSRDRELTTIAHHHLWCWEEAPLGRIGGAIEDLMSNAHVDVLKLNQLTLTNGVNDSLRTSLTGASIDSIFATLNYQLSDEETLNWITEVPKKGLTLYTRSSSSSSFPFSSQFLLKAARLSRVILHAKSDRGSSAETSPLITDSLLLSLLSSNCSCLRLLFHCSSLSAIGILSAIQFLRSLPTTKGFTVYIQSEVADELMELLDDGQGRPFPIRDCKLDKENEKIAIKDLWMEKAYREIRYLRITSSDDSQYTIDDSEKSFFRPISK